MYAISGHSGKIYMKREARMCRRYGQLACYARGARVSADTQQKEATIESQLFELKKQIAAAGDVLVKEYIDDGYTGTLLDRPALERMRADLKTDLFEAVYFHSADRIARDVAHQIIIVGELLKYGKQI